MHRLFSFLFLVDGFWYFPMKYTALVVKDGSDNWSVVSASDILTVVSDYIT